MEILEYTINVWETLLLLSCRDLGVKFVYGDIEDFEKYLKALDNLIMFDASGHRLQPFIRGRRCERRSIDKIQYSQEFEMEIF